MNVILVNLLSASTPLLTGTAGRGIRGARYTLFSGLPCSSRRILNESAEAMICNAAAQ